MYPVCPLHEQHRPLEQLQLSGLRIRTSSTKTRRTDMECVNMDDVSLPHTITAACLTWLFLVLSLIKHLRLLGLSHC
jgi:hypothetical protein